MPESGGTSVKPQAIRAQPILIVGFKQGIKPVANTKPYIVKLHAVMARMKREGIVRI